MRGREGRELSEAGECFCSTHPPVCTHLGVPNSGRTGAQTGAPAGFLLLLLCFFSTPSFANVFKILEKKILTFKALGRKP